MQKKTAKRKAPVLKKTSSIEHWLYMLAKATAEARHEVELAGGELRDQFDAASTAFRTNLPPLIDMAHCQAFISCVAVGQQTQMLTVEEAKTLLYNAQLAMAGFNKKGGSR